MLTVINNRIMQAAVYQLIQKQFRNTSETINDGHQNCIHYHRLLLSNLLQVINFQNQLHERHKCLFFSYLVVRRIRLIDHNSVATFLARHINTCQLSLPDSCALVRMLRPSSKPHKVVMLVPHVLWQVRQDSAHLRTTSVCLLRTARGVHRLQRYPLG